jgi:phosphate transport system protein
MGKHLHRDLELLSRDILTLGARVEESLDLAVRALVDRREDLAERIREADDVIDRAEVEVEENCLKILALHQPVAADLRYVITALKVNNDLERMGDLAVNLAARASWLARRDPIDAAEAIKAMALRVRGMVHQSIASLVERDPLKARAVCAMDDEVDREHKQMYRVLQDLMKADPRTVKRAVQTLSASRQLERVGDLATNIAEDVVFMVEGEVIRHGREQIGENDEKD